MFHLLFVHNTFSSVGVSEWPTYWEIVAHLVSHLFTLYFALFEIIVISHLVFEGGICILIAPVPVHLLLSHIICYAHS